MLQWIQTNLGTMLICAVLIVIVALIVRSLVRQKRQGKSSCGCNCAHCAMHGACPRQKKTGRAGRCKAICVCRPADTTHRTVHMMLRSS